MPITRVSGNLPINPSVDHFKKTKQKELDDAFRRGQESIQRVPIESIKDDLLLNGKDVAKRLNISKTTAYNLMGKELPALRFGGSVRVRSSDLEAFILKSLSSSSDKETK